MLFVFIRLFFCKVCRKINLVAWGGGDFELRKFKLIDRLHFKLVNRINKVLTLSHADKERYEKIYRKQAIVIAYFTINVNLRETVGERVSDIKKIMISHSGWSFLNHHKSFKIGRASCRERVCKYV